MSVLLSLCYRLGKSFELLNSDHLLPVLSPLLRHVWPKPLTPLIPHRLTGTPAFCIKAWKRSYCAIDFISTVPVWQCARAIYLLCLPEDQLSGLAMFIVCGVLPPEYCSIAYMVSEIGHDIFLSLQTCLLVVTLTFICVCCNFEINGVPGCNIV